MVVNNFTAVFTSTFGFIYSCQKISVIRILQCFSVEPLREWVLDLQQATFLHESDNFSEIASFVQKIGTNHTVRDKTAHFATSSPFHFVAARRASFPRAAASLPRRQALSEREVKFCAPARNRTSNNGLEVRSYIRLTTGANEQDYENSFS